VTHRILWQIDMGGGTWAICCMACLRTLYRGDKPGADRVFNRYAGEPVLPLPPIQSAGRT
jgi:hypothetical protein